MNITKQSNGYYIIRCDHDDCNVFYTDKVETSALKLMHWHLKKDHGEIEVQYGHKPSECASVHPYTGHFSWEQSVVRCGYMVGRDMCQIPATNRLHSKYDPNETVDACPEHFQLAWLTSNEKALLQASLKKIRNADEIIQEYSDPQADHDSPTEDSCGACLGEVELHSPNCPENPENIQDR